MIKLKPEYRLPFLIAVSFHMLLLICFLITSPGALINRDHPPLAKTINTQIINPQQIQHQIQAIKHREQQQKLQAERRLRHIQAEVKAAQEARVREQHRLAQLKKQHEIAVVKQKVERQRAAKLKAAQMKAAKLQAQKLAAQMRQAQVLAAKQKQLQQKLLDQQLHAEQQQISKDWQQHLTQMVNQYSHAITQAVRQHWLKPTDLNDQQIVSEFYITLAPGGVVVNVKLVHSSGSHVFDESAKEAILKTSPLPVPKDAAAFNQFRQFYFKFYAQPMT